MSVHWSSVSSWNRDTIPGFQNPAGKFIRHALALNRLGEPGRDRRRVGDRSAHDDRLGAGPTGGSGLIGCVDAAFGDEHRSQTGLTDGADEFEIGAGDRCALAGVAGQGGADDVGTGLGRGSSMVEAAAIGHDQGVRLFVEASDGLGQAQPVGPFAAGPVECDDVGPGQSHPWACWNVGVMTTPSLPSFHSPITGTSTAERVAWMSPSPCTRTAAAPPVTAEAATCAIVLGSRMGSPG